MRLYDSIRIMFLKFSFMIIIKIAQVFKKMTGHSACYFGLIRILLSNFANAIEFNGHFVL